MDLKLVLRATGTAALAVLVIVVATEILATLLR